jgi:hypothetical protein
MIQPLESVGLLLNSHCLQWVVSLKYLGVLFGSGPVCPQIITSSRGSFMLHAVIFLTAVNKQMNMSNCK